jgi:hypothetical protein
MFLLSLLKLQSFIEVGKMRNAAAVENSAIEVGAENGASGDPELLRDLRCRALYGPNVCLHFRDSFTISLVLRANII